MKNKQKQLKSKENTSWSLKALTEEELEATEGLLPRNMTTDEAENEIDEIKKTRR